MSDVECKIADPLWRLNHLYKIKDKKTKSVTFKENIVQARINRTSGNRKMILKARQFGVSTNEILKMFDKTIWTPNYTACILSHEQDSIEKLFRIVIRAYEKMDPLVRPVLARGGGSKYHYYFPEIDSRIYCDLESRSDTINWLHVSEFAFMKDTDRYESTLEAVPMEDGIVTIESTPNGLGNHFHDLWNESETFKGLFFPWYIFPEYALPNPRKKLERTHEERVLSKKARKHGVKLTDGQILFRRAKMDTLKGKFIQEYPEDDKSCFLSSGDAAMDLVKLTDLYEKAKTRVPRGTTDGVKVFLEPNKLDIYVIGADVAEGKGGDYSVGTVINATKMKCAAQIRSNEWQPKEFAHRLVKLAEMYRGAEGVMPEMAVERNNHGHAVLLALDEVHHYPKLYHHTDDEPGWKTDLVTRPLMIDTFIDGIENGSYRTNSLATLNECMTLVSNNGKIEAAKKKHDDCVIADSIGLQLALKAGSLNQYDDMEDIND